MANDTSHKRFFRKPISAWSIAFGGTALGIWLELRSGRIGGTTYTVLQVFAQRNFAATEVVWEAIGFWIACVAWAWMVYVRLRHDDDVSEARIRELIRAINRAPDASVVINYPTKHFQPCMRALGPFSAPSDRSKEEVADRIRKVLRYIAIMARDFARQPEATYGANIMLAASPSQFSLIKAIMNLRFHDSRELGSLAAILYSREALCVSTCDGSGSRVVPAIAVPVPESLTRNGRALAIPGAPRTLLSGAPGVHIDAWKLHEDCSDLSAVIQDEIKQYFSASGEGRDIRSFASFRLGTEGDSPIGILNIDSNREGILGREADYYPTFHALIEPIMAALAVYVQEYARMDFAALEQAASKSATPVSARDENGISQALPDESAIQNSFSDPMKPVHSGPLGT